MLNLSSIFSCSNSWHNCDFIESLTQTFKRGFRVFAMSQILMFKYSRAITYRELGRKSADEIQLIISVKKLRVDLAYTPKSTTFLLPAELNQVYMKFSDRKLRLHFY